MVTPNNLEQNRSRFVRGRAARRIITLNAYSEPAKASGRIKPHQGKREIARRLRRSQPACPLCGQGPCKRGDASYGCILDIGLNEARQADLIEKRPQPEKSP